MKAIYNTAILIIVFLSLAYSGQKSRLSILPSTGLILKGTSTLHDFECKTSSIEGSLDFDPESGHFLAADLKIPVKSIHSESTSMDDNMYEALKSDENPNIEFTFLKYDSAAGSVSLKKDSTFHITGKLAIAGKEKEVDLEVIVKEKGNGVYSVKGEKKLLMTDYGIKPPKFMLGVLKTGNEVTIDFNLDLKEAAPGNQVSTSK